jgi:hypothetical protein
MKRYSRLALEALALLSLQVRAGAPICDFSRFQGSGQGGQGMLVNIPPENVVNCANQTTTGFPPSQYPPGSEVPPTATDIPQSFTSPPPSNTIGTCTITTTKHCDEPPVSPQPPASIITPVIEVSIPPPTQPPPVPTQPPNVVIVPPSLPSFVPGIPTYGVPGFETGRYTTGVPTFGGYGSTTGFGRIGGGGGYGGYGGTSIQGGGGCTPCGGGSGLPSAPNPFSGQSQFVGIPLQAAPQNQQLVGGGGSYGGYGGSGGDACSTENARQETAQCVKNTTAAQNSIINHLSQCNTPSQTTVIGNQEYLIPPDARFGSSCCCDLSKTSR